MKKQSVALTIVERALFIRRVDYFSFDCRIENPKVAGFKLVPAANKFKDLRFFVSPFSSLLGPSSDNHLTLSDELPHCSPASRM